MYNILYYCHLVVYNILYHCHLVVYNILYHCSPVVYNTLYNCSPVVYNILYHCSPVLCNTLYHCGLVVYNILYHCSLVVQLARDLQKDFYPRFTSFFEVIVNILETHMKDWEVLEQAFSCLSYLFKFLWRYMIKDINQVTDGQGSGVGVVDV